jgi:hypothetical protein
MRSEPQFVQWQGMDAQVFETIDAYDPENVIDFGDVHHGDASSFKISNHDSFTLREILAEFNNQ